MNSDGGDVTRDAVGPAFRDRKADVRAAMTTDRVIDVFRFLDEASVEGRRCALVTLTEIVNGASRALGAPMAVCEDGRYCGFVSGGCVEAAAAREAVQALSEGRDRVCRFGQGSAYFDIVLPCGGGLGLTIHVLKEPGLAGAVWRALAQRKAVTLVYDSERQHLLVREGLAPTGWRDHCFVSAYRPDLRIVLTGRGMESLAMASIARAAGVETVEIQVADEIAAADPETAIVLFHHDIDQELPMLRAALQTDAFYIGCLGSRRTHEGRRRRLEQEAYSSEQLDRIHAPIGLFGPAREARSVAVSALAEILSEVERRRP